MRANCWGSESVTIPPTFPSGARLPGSGIQKPGHIAQPQQGETHPWCDLCCSLPCVSQGHASPKAACFLGSFPFTVRLTLLPFWFILKISPSNRMYLKPFLRLCFQDLLPKMRWLSTMVSEWGSYKELIHRCLKPKEGPYQSFYCKPRGEAGELSQQPYLRKKNQGKNVRKKETTVLVTLLKRILKRWWRLQR